MSVRKIVSFQNPTVDPTYSVVDSERRIEGAPEQYVQNLYSAEADTLISGIWGSEVGKWHVDYSNRHEFCYLLAGHMILVDESGEQSTFVKGDSFMIPLGFKGTWEVIEPVKKYYVIQYNNK